VKISCVQCGRKLEYPSGIHGREVIVTCPSCLLRFKGHRKPLDIRDQETLKAIRRLAWKECACFFGRQEDGQCSLFGKCIFYSGESEDCPYFYNCVLPLDPELERQIIWEPESEEKGQNIWEPESLRNLSKSGFRGVGVRVRK